jgi:hypothetical protein
LLPSFLHQDSPPPAALQATSSSLYRELARSLDSAGPEHYAR